MPGTWHWQAGLKSDLISSDALPCQQPQHIVHYTQSHRAWEQGGMELQLPLLLLPVRCVAWHKTSLEDAAAKAEAEAAGGVVIALYTVRSAFAVSVKTSQ